MAGMIVGKLTGDYPSALIGSVALDLDHLLVYYQDGILFKLKAFLAATVNRNELVINQRNYFHNVFFFLAITAIMLLVNFTIGLAFGLAYFGHLILDSLDNSNYYPFYPSKKIKLRGPIKYFSLQELVLAIVLFIIYWVI
jgi:hypothetical protein